MGRLFLIVFDPSILLFNETDVHFTSIPFYIIINIVENAIYSKFVLLNFEKSGREIQFNGSSEFLQKYDGATISY
jgi:hypothetical protein